MSEVDDWITPGAAPVDDWITPEASAQNGTLAVVGNAALKGLTGLIGLPGTISDLTNGAVRVDPRGCGGA